jgi:lambda family phage portal protein
MTYEEQFIRDYHSALIERKREKYALTQQNYAGGKTNRLTYDWPTQIYSPTAILQLGLRSMRARCRDLEINNDYAKKFIWMVKINVGGPEGVKLQNKAKYVPGGILDKGANDKIEEAWLEWNRKGNFDVTGELDGSLTDGLVPGTVARDGELLVRILENFDSEWGFALQFIEADYLDETLTVSQLPNGNSIRMGKEFDKWFRPVAYHILTSHPGDSVWSYNSKKYTRIPADQIIHLGMVERFNQPRYAPWMHASMTRLNNLGFYEEAEIIGSRIGASHMGWYVPGPEADPDSIKKTADGKTMAGEPIKDVEPGMMDQLPQGWDVKQFDPKHPAGNFGPFMKSALRGIASGMLVSYNSLANDLEGVNYSSLRSGALEERDSWKVMQAWFIANYKRPIFERWLRWSLLTQKITLPASKLQQFNKPKFQPRVWAWVDPKNDVEAKLLELDNLLTTRTDIAAEQGEDFQEILIKRQEEERLMKMYGVKPIDKTGGQGTESGDKKKKKDPDEEEDPDMKKTMKDMAATLANVAAMVQEIKNSSTPAIKPEKGKRP